MRSPLTETIKRVEGMIAYVRENLDDGEYDLFLDLILPEPEPVKAVMKGRKKSSKRGLKSSRASGMAAAIKGSLDQQRATKGGACAFVLDNGAVCNTGDNNPIHDESFGYAGYHEFQSAPVAHEAGAGG